MPCVNDLYQDELCQWLRLKSMTIEERKKWWQEKQKTSKANSTEIAAALSPEQFKGYVYETINMTTHINF